MKYATNNMSWFSRALALLVWALLVAGTVHAKRPNIVFIMTDDQAPWAVGAWKDGGLGATHADTPHLARLFKQGVYMPNTFVVTPVCSPSRAALATGRYGSELGITDWINPGKEPKHGLDPKTTTWYESIQEAGYHTALIGKWHLGLTDAHHPTKTGFDYFMGHRGGGWSPNNPTLEKDGKQSKFQGLTTDILTDHAIAHLKEQSNDKPFLLVLHYRAPHARWLPVAPEDWAPFEKLDPKLPHPQYPGLDVPRVKRMMREYLASVRGVDRNVGRVMKTLDELKVADNTLVVFTSDHGYNMGHNGIWHKGNGHWVLKKDALPAATKNVPRGQRPNMYDTSVKVPTAIRWPGVVNQGSTLGETITFLDWFPTLVTIAGGKMPTDVTIRGRDFSPLLRGEKLANWDNDYYGEYSTKHQSRTHMRCYRTANWKLVVDYLNPERDELFNLKKDPGETTNMLNVKNAEAIRVAAELRGRIVERMKQIGDPVAKLAK